MGGVVKVRLRPPCSRVIVSGGWCPIYKLALAVKVFQSITVIMDQD